VVWSPSKRPGRDLRRFRGRLIFSDLRCTGPGDRLGGALLGEGEPNNLNSRKRRSNTKGQQSLRHSNYAREVIRKREYAILVEGYLDFSHSISGRGTQSSGEFRTALTEHQVPALSPLRRKIVVNFDPDSAGVAATKRSLELLLGEGFKVNVLTLPGTWTLMNTSEITAPKGTSGS